MFNHDDVDNLAAKILWISANPTAVREMVERGVDSHYQHLWEGEKARFMGCIATLMRVHKQESKGIHPAVTEMRETRLEVH